MKKIDLRDLIEEVEKQIIVADILSKLDDFYHSTFCEGVEFYNYIKELNNLYDEWLAENQEGDYGVFQDIKRDNVIWVCIGKFLFFSIFVEDNAKENIRSRIYRDEIFIKVGCVLKIVAGFMENPKINAIEDVFNFDKRENEQ